MLQNEIDLSFNYEPVYFGQIKDDVFLPVSETARKYILKAERTDRKIGQVISREENRNSQFTVMIVWDDIICPTVHSHGFYRADDVSRFSRLDYIHAQTFPEDYDEGKGNIAYICGMSVPPVMTKRIVTRMIEAGIFGKK